MKLIRETKGKNELDRLRALLESRGVPVHVGEENQHQLGGHAMPFLRYRVHVLLDSQYGDALKLLEDENHEIAEPVDMKAFRDYQEQMRPEIMNRILGWAAVMALILSALLYLRRPAKYKGRPRSSHVRPSRSPERPGECRR